MAMSPLQTLQKHLPTEGLFDLAHQGIITVTGDNAKNFLQGQVTCDLLEVTPTQSRLAAYCNIKGRVVGTFRIIQVDQQYLLIVDTDIIEIVLKTMRRYAAFSRVTLEISTAHHQHIGILRQNTLLPTLSLPDEIDQVISTDSYTAYRIPSAIPRWELILHTDTLPSSFTLENRKIWDAYNILVGVPTLNQETSAKYTPHRLGLIRLNAISFKKGCYLGQEIVARTEHLSKAKGGLYWTLTTPTVTHSPNMAVLDSNQNIIGHVVSCVEINSDLTLLLVTLNTTDFDSTQYAFIQEFI